MRKQLKDLVDEGELRAMTVGAMVAAVVTSTTTLIATGDLGATGDVIIAGNAVAGAFAATASILRSKNR